MISMRMLKNVVLRPLLVMWKVKVHALSSDEELTVQAIEENRFATGGGSNEITSLISLGKSWKMTT